MTIATTTATVMHGGGGDGYGTFAEGDNPYDFGPPLEQVLADYIASLGGEYTPYTDGRITIIE